jgi:hypothetical protein
MYSESQEIPNPLRSPNVDEKRKENSEMWCWRRMEKISWTDRVKNEKVLHRVKEERNILDTIKRRKVNWIGYVFSRNCIIKYITKKRG